MAAINERKYPSGRIVYRVIVNYKDIPRFTLTFDDYDAAVDWVEKHEDEYLMNPEKYMKDQDDMFLMMRRNKLLVYKHIVRSKSRRFI